MPPTRAHALPHVPPHVPQFSPPPLMSIDPSSSTPLPASIEAGEYSGWEEADPEDQEGTKTRLVAGAEALGDRLDKWLATRLDQYSRARLQQWIGDGHVLVNGAPATIRQRVWERDEVVVMPQPSPDELAFAAEDVPFTIVHEDDAILVVDKRAGLVVHPGSGNWSGTLLNGLLHHDPSLSRVPRAGIVHRLDKDTSGLMVVAKTLEAQTDLVRQLQARSVSRRYVALVQGVVPPGGRIALPIGRDPRDRLRMAAFKADDTAPHVKPAVTRFETLAISSDVSLVLCTLETGRTHQIRVHLQALGHPLVGDPVYGGVATPARVRASGAACVASRTDPSVDAPRDDLDRGAAAGPRAARAPIRDSRSTTC